jgi:hypothetical protein
MIMKKQLIAISTVVLLGTAGAVLADEHKLSICHNGSTYNSTTMSSDPISFEITIAGKERAKAVQKHVENHGDLETYVILGTGEECELQDDGETVVCDEVTLCGPLPPV